MHKGKRKVVCELSGKGAGNPLGQGRCSHPTLQAGDLGRLAFEGPTSTLTLECSGFIQDPAVTQFKVP